MDGLVGSDTFFYTVRDGNGGSATGIASVSVFSLILAGPDTKTVPVAVFNFISYGSINFGGIAAAAVLITLPVVVLTLFVQRHILRGLTGGGVKG